MEWSTSVNSFLSPQLVELQLDVLRRLLGTVDKLLTPLGLSNPAKRCLSTTRGVLVAEFPSLSNERPSKSILIRQGFFDNRSCPARIRFLCYSVHHAYQPRVSALNFMLCHFGTALFSRRRTRQRNHCLL